MFRNLIAASFAVLVTASGAFATTTSPTSEGALPGGVTAVGGVVVDMVGANGTRVVSQLAASSLFTGFAAVNPFEIGTQTGFNAGVLGALGGGIAEMAIRFTLFDGDTAAGNFDFNDNTLLVNGSVFGNWSAVSTLETNGAGALTGGAGNPSSGFHNNELRTGFFFSTDATLLGNIFTSLGSTNEMVFSVDDVDPGDNFYDFTQGIDGGLINVGTGPVITNPVPLPAAGWLMIAGIAGLGAIRARRKQA